MPDTTKNEVPSHLDDYVEPYRAHTSLTDRVELMEKRAKAKDLYFQYVPAKHIASQLKLSTTTLQRWISGKSAKGVDKNVEKTWKYQREQAKKQTLGDAIESNDFHIQRIYRSALPIIARSVESLERETLGMDDLRKLTEVVTSIDKLLRLNANQPTDITKTVHSLSLDQVRKFMDDDPFMRRKIAPPAPIEAEVVKPPPKPMVEGQIDMNKVKFMDVRPDEEPEPTNEDLELPGKWEDGGE